MHELFNFSIVIRKIFTNTTRTLNISYLFLHACIKIRITIQRTCPHAYRLFLLSNPELIKSFFFFLPNEQREKRIPSRLEIERNFTYPRIITIRLAQMMVVKIYQRDESPQFGRKTTFHSLRATPFSFLPPPIKKKFLILHDDR